MELNENEVNQLASYCDLIEADDLYYGTKKDFKDRHENIKIYLKNLMLKYERINVKK